MWTRIWISVGLWPPLGWRYALSLSSRFAPLPSGARNLGKRQVIVNRTVIVELLARSRAPKSFESGTINLPLQ